MSVVQSVVEVQQAPELLTSPVIGLSSNAFEDLVKELTHILGPSSGLDSDDVNVSHIVQAMERYKSMPSEWLNYAFADPSRGYTRNLVDKGNGKSNLLVLVWTPGKGSPIHDHANAHCVMKVLSGSLTETLYNWPDDYSSAPLSIKREKVYSENEVTYMSDQLGLHKVHNADPARYAISLHLYTPPNAAKHGCYMFDEKTGVGIHINQCQFFSEFGSRITNA